MEKPNSDLEIKTEGWKQINWVKTERYVFKLQKRIYAASRRGDVKQVRKLQVQHEVAYYAPKCVI
ncbi:reverse transcriptase N-terminal domain-containing protein [Brasilonema sp. UFV-L1]|uniref:reverse transcriptase N-terminal domain-containing protein n=1 Tax=Brasilonema sp. UFV-L1 TaxID=2234130 RepID=UPI0030DB53AF